MRIVTWNCNGAFRKKYSRLKIDDKYPDILVIQECENPELSKDKKTLYYDASGDTIQKK